MNNMKKEVIRMHSKEDRTISVRKIKYDIKGKANGEQKRYKLKCVFCGSCYTYNNMSPYDHWHTKKCIKVRKTPCNRSYNATKKEIMNEYENAVANCDEKTRGLISLNDDYGYKKVNSYIYDLIQIGQKITQVYYHNNPIINEEEDIKRGYEVGKGRYSIRRIVYDFDYEEELKKRQIKPFVDKISNWFLHIKYNPEYKYGRKHINSLYDENF